MPFSPAHRSILIPFKQSSKALDSVQQDLDDGSGSPFGQPKGPGALLEDLPDGLSAQRKMYYLKMI